MKKITLFFILAFTMACAKIDGTSTGNPLVSIQFKNFSAFQKAAVAEPMTVSLLKMCFKRLRFKPASGLGENINLALDEISILSSGTLVATAQVPPGTYTRVEFDLDDHCASGTSVQVTNSNGTFQTDDSITIRFEGTFTLLESQDLNLDIQTIVSSLNNVNSNSSIKNLAESASGSF